MRCLFLFYKALLIRAEDGQEEEEQEDEED